MLDLEQSGLNTEEALYYAKLDKLVESVENGNVKLNVNYVKDDLSDEYVRLHKKDFQNDVLALDSRALKKGLLSEINLRENGQKEMQKYLDKYAKKEGKMPQKFTLEFADGSSISVSTGVEEVQDVNNSQVTTNTACNNVTPHISGNWNSSTCVNYEFGKAYYDNGYQWPTTTKYYNAWLEWKFDAVVSWSKVKDTISFNYVATTYSDGSLQGSTLNITNNTGVTAAYGVALVKSENIGSPKSSGSGLNKYVQGYTDAWMEVTGAFTASYFGLGISVTTGGQWHQYAIVEANGESSIFYFAGKYA